MHVEILRSTGLFRAGTTVELDDASAQHLIGQGVAKERRIDAPARNASRDEWADYATRLGHTVPEGAGRDDIIALTEAPAV